MKTKTAAERVARAYAPEVHPAARPLFDAIAHLDSYEVADRADLARLVASLGGLGDGTINASAEIAVLVEGYSRHPLLGRSPEAAELGALFSEMHVQGEGEEIVNQLVYRIQGEGEVAAVPQRRPAGRGSDRPDAGPGAVAVMASATVPAPVSISKAAPVDDDELYEGPTRSTVVTLLALLVGVLSLIDYFLHGFGAAVAHLAYFTCVVLVFRVFFAFAFRASDTGTDTATEPETSL
ncbi:hypothetical protein ACFYXM_11745 [Streptomyces sp. NPDC002476]|uniref:hypothetical protein n=1 Tax=Streptomyces sp. NPDC002476 TaxID=3364648 RepID=UPI0036C63BB4